MSPQGLESDSCGGGNLEKVSHTAEEKQERDKENTCYLLPISRACAWESDGERARARERERKEREGERFPLCPLHSPLSTLNTHVYRN